MNAIITNYPEYAVSYNAHEQAGLNDGVGMFLQSMGVDVELRRSEENMIKLSPNVGVDFLHWTFILVKDSRNMIAGPFLRPEENRRSPLVSAILLQIIYFNYTF